MGRLLDPDTRLLTLTGPGGTGKTRLALQAAAEATDRFPDGLFWVALAPLRDSSLVLPMVAQTLEIGEQPGQVLADAIASALLGKQVLLLLDNAEHLLPELANDLAEPAASLPDSPAPRHQPRAHSDRGRGKLARSDARRERG